MTKCMFKLKTSPALSNSRQSHPNSPKKTYNSEFKRFYNSFSASLFSFFIIFCKTILFPLHSCLCSFLLRVADFFILVTSNSRLKSQTFESLNYAFSLVNCHYASISFFSSGKTILFNSYSSTSSGISLILLS